MRDAMRQLGMPEVRSVRIGKYMEIEIEGQNGELESRLHQLCSNLLSNPVIEDYELLRRVRNERLETRNEMMKALRYFFCVVFSATGSADDRTHREFFLSIILTLLG